MTHGRNTHAPSAILTAALLAALGTAGCKAGEGEACGWGTECAAALVCMESTGKCERMPPPIGYCEPANTGCPDDREGFQCSGGATPADKYVVDCTAVRDGAAQSEILYCCTRIPHCDQLGRCGDPGVTYGCTDPVVPQATDPSLECATVNSIGGWSSYCCAHETACFAADLFGCGDAGESYACTGDAAPDQYGLACTPGYYADAGAKGTYCCDVDAGSD